MELEDKRDVITKANDVAIKMIRTFYNEMKEDSNSGEPGEQFYVTGHTLAIVATKMMMTLDGFRQIYDMEHMDYAKIQEWIYQLIEEYYKINFTGSDLQ